VEQILLGYLAEEWRPSELDVHTDRSGMLYMPRIGYFATRLAEHRLRMHVDKGRRYRLYNGIEPVLYSFAPIQTVAMGRIEVLRDNHPSCSRMFANTDGTPENVDVEHITRKQYRTLDAALEIIARLHPHYYDSIIAATKKIVIFQSDTLNSFADISAHGIAFLNAADYDSEVFFIEDVAHQCGHLVFGALTFDREEFLAVLPDTPLRLFTEQDNDDRSVYDAFHGVFTEAFMFQCMNECYVRHIFDGQREHELVGRLAFILRRFGSDLSILSRYPLFTAKGEILLGEILRIFKSAYDTRWPTVNHLDLSNQDYNFKYNKFVEINGRANTNTAASVR
jgi:hypothetical protein